MLNSYNSLNFLTIFQIKLWKLYGNRIASGCKFDNF